MAEVCATEVYRTRNETEVHNIAPSSIDDVLPQSKTKQHTDFKPDVWHLYMNEVDNYPPLSKEEEYALFKELEEHRNNLNKPLIMATLYFSIKKFNSICEDVKSNGKERISVKRVDGSYFLYSVDGSREHFRHFNYNYWQSKEQTLDRFIPLLIETQLDNFIGEEAYTIITAKAGIQGNLPEDIYADISKNTVRLSPQQAGKVYDEILPAERRIREIKDKIASHNQRVVISISKEYRRKYNGAEPTDIVSWGNEGLLKAIEKFDYRKGYKFSTYSSLWIMSKINGGIAYNSSLIRTPHNKNNLINAVKGASNILLQERGRIPTDEEIIDYLYVVSDTKFLPDKIKEAMKHINKNTVSLDKEIGDNGKDTFKDFIPDFSVESLPAYSAGIEMLREGLEQVVKELTIKEQIILKLRYGYDTLGAIKQIEQYQEKNRDYGIMGRFEVISKTASMRGSKTSQPKPDRRWVSCPGRFYTLEEVGYIFGVARERIRQIEEGAVKKLKYDERKKKLELAHELLSGTHQTKKCC